MDATTVPFDASQLPIAQLESLRFKANQIIESIQSLQRTIEVGYAPFMPSWPDILSKYNILLSQTHSFSTSLVSSQKEKENIYEKIALHPALPLSDTQLDNEVIPLLRNQQTTDVLNMENDTVRRLSEHMSLTRGSLGVLTSSSSNTTYEDVLRECAEIRSAHDHRAERAIRAVTMLRDKFDWKTRVMVAEPEPEELTWDPRMARELDEEEEDVEEGEEEGSEDEDEVEGHLVNGDVDVTPTNAMGAEPVPTTST